MAGVSSYSTDTNGTNEHKLFDNLYQTHTESSYLH